MASTIMSSILQAANVSCATGKFISNGKSSLGCQDNLSTHNFATCGDMAHCDRSILLKRRFIVSEMRKASEVKATEPSKDSFSTSVNSILCKECNGNGAVVCSQCKGDGINKQDFFNGQFKAGTICWLCRGKREMLCGNCNGAGFLGGFMNAFED